MKNLIEVIIDTMSNTYLGEMAYERKHAIKVLQSLNHQISTHVLKVIAFESTAKAHWVTEIDAWLNTIDDIMLKQKHSKLSFNILYEFLVDAYLEDVVQVSSILKKIEIRTQLQRNEISDSEVWGQASTVLTNICEDLSEDSFKGSIRHYVKNYTSM